MNVFCIGNAESRRGIDLEKYRPHGKLYGCNALTRDFTPDVITSVDNGIMHEIFHKGLAYQIPCFFRNWTKLPIMGFDSMITDAGMEDSEMNYMRENGFMVENNRTEETTQFVLHGSTVKGVADIIKKDGTKEKQNVNRSNIYVSYVDPKLDKTTSLVDYMKWHNGEFKDFGWAAGPTSGYVACKREKPSYVFMLGHDLFSKDRHVNNMYKSTKHYVTAEHQPTPCINWIKQWLELFKMYPDIQFFKVQQPYDENDQTTKPVLEWNGIKNINYIDYSRLDNILNL